MQSEQNPQAAPLEQHLGCDRDSGRSTAGILSMDVGKREQGQAMSQQRFTGAGVFGKDFDMRARSEALSHRSMGRCPRAKCR